MIKTIAYEGEGALPAYVLPEDTELAGRYRILGTVGIGGFGISYLCEDMQESCNVLLKEYYPGSWVFREETFVTVSKSAYLKPYRYGLEAFRKEAELMEEGCDVPHLVRYQDFFEENDTAYIVMEYIEGVSISREMKQHAYRNGTTPAMAADIMTPVLEALAGLHEKGIVHSDVSPGNIMRGKSGDICLIDLGAAKKPDRKQQIFSAAFLKPDYAAPEQFRTAASGIPDAEGPWTDIYGAGATLYFLLSGTRPQGCTERLQKDDSILELPGKLRRRKYRKWAEILRKSMELQPEKRYQSAAEMLEVLTGRQIGDSTDMMVRQGEEKL